MHFLGEQHILLFLVQVFILLLGTRGLGEVFRRYRQPTLTAELLVGILLGPTVLGRVLPEFQQALFPADALQQTMLETVAWIGVLFMLLETGLEIDFSVAWRQRGHALTIAIADITVPMVVAFVPCLLLPDRFLVDPSQRLIFALFMATVMTISAMPVAARALHDLNLLKSEMGFLVMSALAVNDVIGWVLFTLVLGFFMGGDVSAGRIAGLAGLTVGFAALALTLGRRISTAVLGRLRRHGLPEPGTSLTFLCLLGLLFGVATQKLGIHALFGFFIAGVVLGEARNVSEETRGIIAQMVYAIFVPLFFANIGLKIDFAANFDLGLVLFVCAIGIAGRFLGAWLGVTCTTVPRVNRTLIAVAHTPGGMMEIVVALVAFETGLISSTVFVAIVVSAVLSSVVLGPWMAWALQRRAAVRVADLLARDAVLPVMSAGTRTDAIRELTARAAPALGADLRDRALAGLLEREASFGTALGGGVAVPHVRLAGVAKPLLVVGRLPQGVDWDAPDGQPVHLAFLLVTPADAADTHVQILARIARAVQDPQLRPAVDAAADGPALWQALWTALSR